ncbi:Coiled-coil domain-containing protein 169 [Acropora cervicornis]|uniref:Coiled-coil domain-containing protein 169 n=1 Tax=Acropora cervicornis TaxID=6130 RepID=A0AAD9UTS2_ACRCE|nr:Coiled-coil domain-containing protein 169 [Acropora cervicornis]
MHSRRATDITPVEVRKGGIETGVKKSKKRARTSRKSSKMSSPRSQKPPPQLKGPKNELDYEIERLKAEIQQEQQMKEMLEQSTVELENTISDLEQKSNVKDEDNEWKARFQTQQEMNNQLEKQIVLLREKLGHLKIPSRDEIRKLMRQLEKDKVELQGQLRDLEWRLDNESKGSTGSIICGRMIFLALKYYIHADLLRNLTPMFVGDGAYHKINEERKKYLTELDETASFIDETKTKTRQALSEAMRENESQLQTAKIKNPRQFGLPDNQRIIDPRKGPVKKAAAVRKLPKLDSYGSGSNGSTENSTMHN